MCVGLDTAKSSTKVQMSDLEGFTEMAHQVGGHATPKTCLKAHNGRILKPFQSKGRGMREHDFYERVFVSKSGSLEFAELQKFLPKYYGTITVSEVTHGEDEVHPRRKKTNAL